MAIQSLEDTENIAFKCHQARLAIAQKIRNGERVREHYDHAFVKVLIESIDIEYQSKVL